MTKKIIIFFLLCSTVLAQDNPYRAFLSFNAGELGPYLVAREDLAKYHSGCSIMENMIPLPQGGAQKRPGTKYIAEVKTSSLATRIIPFEYSTEQSYIIEVGNQYMRFFTSSAVVYEPINSEDLTDFGANVVAQWKCNDNAANTTVNDTGDAGDHDGTADSFTNTYSTTNSEGTANSAFLMGNEEIITVADHSDFTFISVPFSVMAWIKYDGSGLDLIVSKGDGAAEEWYIGVDTTDKIEFQCTDESANKKFRVDSVSTLDTNWHFLVVTYSGVYSASPAAGESGAGLGVRFYLDWVEIDTTITHNESGYVAMENLGDDLIIAGFDTEALDWEGSLDNIAIFDKELTHSEIASIAGASTTTVYEIVTPYLTADLFELKFEQSADVLFITHPDYETRKLSRLANSIWSLDVFGAENGPFRTQNDDTSAKIVASATTGSVTLTATGGAPFVDGTTAGHEPSGSATTSKSQTGALFKLVHPLDTLTFYDVLEDDIDAGQVEGVSWFSCGTLYEGAEWDLVTGGTWLGVVEVQRNYTIGASATDSGWETVLQFKGVTTARNVTTSGTEDDGDADYRFVFADDTSGAPTAYFTTDQTEVVGIVKITAIASTTSATATVLKTLGSTNTTHKWSEGSWSNYRGWPQTVTFFEDRLFFGGNTAQPDTLWGSVTSDYENMTAGADDDEAVIFTLSSRQVNVIEWLIGKDKLLIGTSGAEWTIAGGTDEPLTPSNVIAKQHSTYGSANLQAVIANESVLFFQRGAEKMRELAYNWEIDSYVAPDMTILAKEVTGDGIVDTAFQQIPDSILWCVRDDGELPIFSYERKENITAWSRMITTDSTADSDFESVARISGDPEDEVWVVVERYINSGTVRYIEQFQPRDFGSDPCDAFYVDSGATYTTDVNVISDLTWLEGESVVALADGTIVTDLTVSSNTVTLGAVYQQVQIGLPYTVQLRTMPLSWLDGTTIHGRMKRVSEVIAEWYKSGDFSIGKDADTLETYSLSGQTTGIDRKTFPPGYDRNGYVFVWQQSPEPLTLLAIMVEFNLR